jgi:hypothetical protein
MADISMLKAEQAHITEALDSLHEWYQTVIDKAGASDQDRQAEPTAGPESAPPDSESPSTLRTGRRPPTVPTECAAYPCDSCEHRERCSLAE